MRTHQVREMISRLHSLITGSPVVEWHRRLFDSDYAFISDKAASNLYKIKGPAAGVKHRLVRTHPQYRRPSRRVADPDTWYWT
jgi:hypothetical protein